MGGVAAVATRRQILAGGGRSLRGTAVMAAKAGAVVWWTLWHRSVQVSRQAGMGGDRESLLSADGIGGCIAGVRSQVSDEG